MIHRGEVVEKAIRNSGISITEIGRRIYYTRTSLYRMFQNKNLPLDLIIKIGNVLNYDFSLDIPELQSTTPHVDRLHKKYCELLEEYNKLLIVLFKNKINIE